MNAGIKYMMLATFFYSVMNVAVKMLPGIPVYEIIFFRAVITLLMSVVAIKRAGLSLAGNNKPLLIARGVCGMVSLYLFFVTLKQIPIASAVVIQYLSPIFSTILAIFILGQPMTTVKWAFYAVAFAGVFMVKGFDDRVSLLMFLCGLGSAVVSGIGYNIIGKLKGQDDPRVVVMYFPLVTLPVISVPTIYHWVTPTWQELLWLIAMGVFTQLAQLYMTYSYQAENIGKVAIFQYIGIAYALIYGYLFFDETFNLQSISGMLLVAGGVILSVIYGVWEKNKKQGAD